MTSTNNPDPQEVTMSLFTLAVAARLFVEAAVDQLRPAFVAAGRPADHPYMLACALSVASPRPRFCEPLVVLS